MQRSDFSSIVQIAGINESHCGYCKNTEEETSISYGVISSKMNINHYEAMMLKGWRRSGSYFYKPLMHATCCPPYPIRVKTDKFVISKGQRQVVRRLDRYLSTGDIHATEQQQTTYTSLKQSHIFTIETVKPEVTPERYQLYKKYQMAIHGDKEEDITELRYAQFLVDSPLYDSDDSSSSNSDISSIYPLYSSPSSSSQGQSANNNNSTNSSNSSSSKHKTNQPSQQPQPRSIYGTFHQLYRIDNKLIAVGVIDILKSGLSSVYMYYDPEYRTLVLGKYTAICELQFCQKYKFEYYYMGFYIHTCEKMKYKAEFSPSELLCPITYIWYDYSSICKPLLDIHVFTGFDCDWLRRYEASLSTTTATANATTATTDVNNNNSGNAEGHNSYPKDSISQDKPTDNNNTTNNTTTILLPLPYHHTPTCIPDLYLDIRPGQPLIHYTQLPTITQKEYVYDILLLWVQTCGDEEVSKNILLQFY